MAIIIAVVATAFFIDNYLEKNPVKLTQNQEEQGQPKGNETAFILYNPVNNFTAKPFIQKTPVRFTLAQLHDKFLRKHHQLRIFFALKAIAHDHKPPVLSCFYILRKDYLSGAPDDDPFLP